MASTTSTATTTSTTTGSASLQAKLQQIFHKCKPRDADGHVAVSTVESLLRHMTLVTETEATLLRRALLEQDANRDRFVSFAEFQQAICAVLDLNAVSDRRIASATPTPDANSSGSGTDSQPGSRRGSFHGSTRSQSASRGPAPAPSSNRRRQRDSIDVESRETYEVAEDTTARMLFDLLDEDKKGYITMRDLQERWGEVTHQPLPSTLTQQVDDEDERVTFETFAAAFVEEPESHSTPMRSATMKPRSSLASAGRNRRSMYGSPASAAGRLSNGLQEAGMGSPASPLLITAGVSALQRKIKALEAQLQSAHDETAHLRRELKVAQETIQRSSDLAEKDITLAESDLERHKMELEKRRQADLAEMREQYEETFQQQRRRIEALESELAKVHASSDNKAVEVEELKKDKSGLLREVLTLRETLEQAQSAVSKAHQRDGGMLRLLEERNTHLQQANSELERSVHAFTRELDQRAHDNQLLRDEVEELRERLEQKLGGKGAEDWDEADTLANELSGNAGKQRLTAELQAMEKRHQAAVEQLQAQLAQAAEASDQLAGKWKAYAAELEAERDEFEMRLEAVKQQLTAAEAARLFAEQRLSRRERGSEGSSMINAELLSQPSTNAIFSDPAQVRKLVHEAFDTSKRNQELEMALQLSRKNRDALEADLQADNARLAAEVTKASQRELALQNRLAEAKAKLLAEQGAFAAYKLEMAELQKQNDERAHQRIAELEATTARLYQRLANPGSSKRGGRKRPVRGLQVMPSLMEQPAMEAAGEDRREESNGKEEVAHRANNAGGVRDGAVNNIGADSENVAEAADEDEEEDEEDDEDTAAAKAATRELMEKVKSGELMLLRAQSPSASSIATEPPLAASDGNLLTAIRSSQQAKSSQLQALNSLLDRSLARRRLPASRSAVGTNDASLLAGNGTAPRAGSPLAMLWASASRLKGDGPEGAVSDASSASLAQTAAASHDRNMGTLASINASLDKTLTMSRRFDQQAPVVASV